MVISKRLILEIIAGVILALLVAVNLYSWFGKAGGGSTQPVTEAKDSKVVKGMTQKDYTVTHVHVYEKADINKKIPEIPESIKNDATVQYTAVKDVPAYEGTTRAIATMKDGTTDILLQKQPLSFLALEAKLNVGAGYYPVRSKNMGDVGGDLTFRFLRIERAHVEIKADADNKGNWRAGPHVSYEHNFLK